ncbi:hypothetical protein JOC85_002463 [Bacillus mesophilus]|nr:hypothetical protein [Bacillus mesophilus]
MEKLMELRKISLNSEGLSWSDSLFLPGNKDWNLDSKSLLINMDFLMMMRNLN